jgi:hypothetical protein
MNNDPTRTTPIGMARYAYEFMEAALAVDNSVGNRPGYELVAPIPALYLVGHSIELSLKAYLLHQDASLRDIRHFGHDLHALFRKAKELGLLDHVQFDGPEKGAVEILNDLYSTKQLEYIVTGTKHFPLFGLIETFSVKLFNTVAALVGLRERFDSYSQLDIRENPASVSAA